MKWHFTLFMARSSSRFHGQSLDILMTTLYNSVFDLPRSWSKHRLLFELRFRQTRTDLGAKIYSTSRCKVLARLWWPFLAEAGCSLAPAQCRGRPCPNSGTRGEDKSHYKLWNKLNHFGHWLVLKFAFYVSLVVSYYISYYDKKYYQTLAKNPIHVLGNYHFPSFW